MRRIKLIIAYDGTNYCGWQIQPTGRSIEGCINSALSALTGEEIHVIGASRTDSGVHAMGNVAVFDTESRIPGEKFAYAINQRLPDDIRIISSEETDIGFHPRKANCIKTYRYSIFNERIEDPLRRLYAHFCYYPLNIEKMREAAVYLLGEHDFRSYTNPDSQVLIEGGSSVREIYSIDIETEHDREYDITCAEKSGKGQNKAKETQKGHYGLITITIKGNGFLYNMVRIIVGTLLRVGTGLYEPPHITEITEARDRQMAGPTAPARGLCLMELDYEDETVRVKKHQ